MIEQTEYYKYAQDVLSGRINACETIKQAASRFMEFLERDDMYFDKADVDKKIRFVSKMKHSTGVHAGKPFILLPWQQFAFANIFGFKWKENNYRVTKKVFMFLSRKNGKTALAAALSLCCTTIDNESGAEVDFVANSAKQAGICFRQTKDFAQSIDPKGLIYKIYRNDVRVPCTKSYIQTLSSDSMGNDGYNSQMFVIDEMHAQRNWDLYNVMKSSQGMRTQPLSIVITTAGFLIGDSYPCYSMWNTCKDILSGTKQDDSQFSLIYQLDEGDDWTDESNWIKCSPSLGQTVTYEYMRDEVQSALNNTSLEVGVRTKNFNEWMQSAEVWLPHNLLVTNSIPFELEDICKDKHSYAYVGVDLSAVSDLTAVSAMIEKDGKCYFKTWLFLPESALKESANGELYKEAHRKGYLHVTEGNVVDYDYILNKVLEINKICRIASVNYDSWNATQWAISAEQAGLPLEPFSQAIGNFNRPTKEFERLLRSNRVVLDRNPLVIWCFDNAQLKVDWNDNCKPTKGDSRCNKIDAVISNLQALGGALNEPVVAAKLTTL